MVEIVNLEGFKELAAALEELPKRTARNTLNRALKQIAEPIRARWAGSEDRRTGDLASSIVVGKVLTRSQRAQARRDTLYFAEQHVGTDRPKAKWNEFGGDGQPATPDARPAWDAEKDKLVPELGKILWKEIEKAAKRRAKKLAKG